MGNTPPAKGVWPVADAKAHFSELIDTARHGGPQTITRNGRPAVVVVSVEEWERRAEPAGAPKRSLYDLLRASPLVGSDAVIERYADKPRDVDL